MHMGTCMDGRSLIRAPSTAALMRAVVEGEPSVAMPSGAATHGCKQWYMKSAALMFPRVGSGVTPQVDFISMHPSLKFHRTSPCSADHPALYNGSVRADNMLHMPPNSHCGASKGC